MNFAIRYVSQLDGIQVFEFVSYHRALEAAQMFGATLHRIYGRRGSSPVLSPAL